MPWQVGDPIGLDPREWELSPVLNITTVRGGGVAIWEPAPAPGGGGNGGVQVPVFQNGSGSGISLPVLALIGVAAYFLLAKK